MSGRLLALCAVFFSFSAFSENAKKKVEVPLYTPDPKQWKLELRPQLGGWLTEGVVELRLRVLDPRDPNPPKEETRRSYDYEYFEGDGEDAPQRTAAEYEAERQAQEQEERANAWRQRRVQVWFNGSAQSLSIQVGHWTEHSLASQNGENRLEILEPDSGQRVVRTWWASAARTRLRIRRLQDSEEGWVSGSLEVLEPSGDLCGPGRRTPSGGFQDWGEGYRHPTPPPGTYTLRWTGGWRGGSPAVLRLEALLDGGTDRERRWTFERLILPGSGPVTLGTLDVED